MDRLTYDFCIGENHCWEVHGADNNICADVCKDQGDKGCEDCPIRKAIDRLAAYEDAMPIERAQELAQAEKDGRMVILPCRVWDVIYHVFDSCNLTGDCGTKMKCRGCEYRDIGIEISRFSISLLDSFGRLIPEYFLTRKEAEAALEKREVDNEAD